MKVAETKTTTSTLQKKGEPFFQKGRDQGFFSDCTVDSSFFAKRQNTRPLIQAKLTVGQPGDKYEREADDVADKVVQRLAMPDPLTKKEPAVQAKSHETSITPLVQAKCAACEQEEKLQKKEEEDRVEDSPLELQRKPIFENRRDSALQMKCPECENEEEIQKKETDEEEKEIQEKSDQLPEINLKPIFESEAEPIVRRKNSEGLERNGVKNTEVLSAATKTIIPGRKATLIQTKCAACEQEELQKKEDDKEDQDAVSLQAKSHDVPYPSKASASVETGINSTKGGGRTLPKDVRSRMESSFGADFSGVRIHNDSHAVQMNEELHSQAFTHGRDIYFNAGKYDDKSSSGQHLLAHELTHTVQQGASTKANIQTKKNGAPDIQCLLGPIIWWGGHYVAGKVLSWGWDKLFGEEFNVDSLVPITKIAPIDIKGMANFSPPGFVSKHIRKCVEVAEELRDYNSSGFLEVPDNVIENIERGPSLYIKYGDIGEKILVRIGWDPATGSYQMDPYQMILNHPMFDLSQSGNVLGMQAKIDSGRIDGQVCVANLSDFVKKILLAAFYDAPSAYAFDFQLLEKAVIGEDAAEVTANMMFGYLANGYINVFYSGVIDIHNENSIKAHLSIDDKQNKEEWKGGADLHVMGMQPYTLDIDRSPQGILSGINKDKKILLDKSFAKKGTDSDDEKGFEFTSNLTASYLNKILTIQGEATYNSSRAQGNLFLIVTDYSTAKSYATQYLPKEIAEKAATDAPPENPSEKLAFMGAGNLSFTLFDGNKETRKLRKLSTDTLFDEKPEEQPNIALQANASFVVEPEGYITIAGQIKPVEEEFKLFNDYTYERDIELLEIPIAKIPGPLTTRADFNFTVNLGYGAKIGPLTLSEIKAEGLYSNRPDTASELELSGLIKLPGELFVKLKFCVEVEGSILGVFEVTLIEACIEAGVGVAGAVQARPTISLGKLNNINTPPEYYIRGDFHFDAGGKIFLFVGDSLKINLTEKDNPDPRDWRYKNSKEVAKKEFGSRDIEIPMDHTLGSQEIPGVSFRQFAKENLKRLLSKMITADRPPSAGNVDKYFEPGKASGGGGTAPTGESKFSSGGFEEGREKKGGLVDDSKATPASDSEASFVFTESFLMWGTGHELQLIITQSEKGGTTKIDTLLVMSSELEELAEKVDEEKTEIPSSNDAATAIQKSDLATIETHANEVKGDAQKLGVDNQLSNQSQFPALKETAVSIQNYGSRYKKNDLGEPDQPVQPACDKPKDVHPGDEIFFPNYTGDENIGFVIEIVSYPTKDKKQAFWHIRYKPKSARKATSVAPMAFDNQCNPTYIIPKTDKNCDQVKLIYDEIVVPARSINNMHVPQRKKAYWVKAYPLCWGEELKPKANLVGLDRISPIKQGKWHRAHLVHAKMGGKGAYWNLAPVPQLVNNSKMPAQYESKLINLVLTGFNTGKQYWFKAGVVYYKDSDNPVVGHFDDFVKEIKIYYGEAIDQGNGKWDLKDDSVVRTTIQIGQTPSSTDLASDRIPG